MLLILPNSRVEVYMSDSYAALWAYPWDLADEGPQTVLRRLREEVGVDGVSLASAYHTFEMLRPHSSSRALLQIPQAAVYFQPQAELYRGTPIRPHVSPLMGAENWYADAARAAAAVGLDLIAWTVFLHNSYQAGAHPECAEVACTGDISTSRLCPSNPAVRAFAVALSRDLVQNYGISALECESLSFGGFGHTHYHVKYGIEPGRGGRFLFSLCFCPACRDAARGIGIDADALARVAELQVRESFASGRPIREMPEELIAASPELSAYIRLREDTVASLLREVRDAAGVPASFLVMGDRYAAGVDRARIASIADYMEVLSYTADPARTGRTVSGMLPDLRSSAQLMVGLQAYPPASPDAETLRANAQGALDLGVRRFSFYNYGIMPMSNLSWVRSAVEAIRRSAVL